MSIRRRSVLLCPSWRTALRAALWVACLTSPALMARAADVGDAGDFLYTVQPGDNPWNLTERYLLDLGHWRRLVSHNQIADDKRLQPGSVLRIPLPWLKLSSTSVRLAGVSGKVEVDTGAGWQPALAGAELGARHRLRTHPGGSAVLALADGSATRVREDSELSIATAGRLVATGALWLRIELVRGQLENQVHGLRRSGGRFEVQTPAAVTTVRGTVFRVGIEGATTRAEVLDGRVDLANTLGAEPLGAATGSRVETSRRPEPARALLAAPPLGALPADGLDTPQDLGRPALAGALAFRTRILANDQLEAAVLHEQVGPTIALPTLADGRYLLVVRGIDEIGLEGLNTSRTLTVRASAPAAPPPPPPSAVPIWQRAHPGDQLELRWSALGPDRLYQLQVLLDPADGGAIVLDELVRGDASVLPVPPPGRYRVRVRLAPSIGFDPPWSEEQVISGWPVSRPRVAGWWSAAFPR